MLKIERHCEISAARCLGARHTDIASPMRDASARQCFSSRITTSARRRCHSSSTAQYMEQFGRARREKITRDRVRRAFSHLVLSDRVLDQLGPRSTRPFDVRIRPPVTARLSSPAPFAICCDGEIAIPHAIEVEGSIIRVFDPVNHEPMAPPENELGLDDGQRDDARWVRCRRPMVMVGGELTLEKLELSYSPGLGFYRAPIQAVANGGVLVIDDFGRQTCSPRDFLNRWIVPLESRIDYLTFRPARNSKSRS